METQCARFAELLERERDAAMRADLEALAAIQEEKQAAMFELRASKLRDSDISALIGRAQANIGLIRHLVVCLRGCLPGGAEPTYTAAGERKLAKSSYLRGVL